jgi:hypothetical protein
MVVRAVANARSVRAVVVDDIAATVDDVADIPAAVTDIPASSTVDHACVGVSVSVRVHGVGVCHAVVIRMLLVLLLLSLLFKRRFLDRTGSTASAHRLRGVILSSIMMNVCCVCCGFGNGSVILQRNRLRT